MPKMVNFASFWKPEAFGQTVLPDRSISIGQKLVQNGKLKNSNEIFLVIFKHCEIVPQFGSLETDVSKIRP